MGYYHLRLESVFTKGYLEADCLCDDNCTVSSAYLIRQVEGRDFNEETKHSKQNKIDTRYTGSFYGGYVLWLSQAAN